MAVSSLANNSIMDSLVQYAAGMQLVFCLSTLFANPKAKLDIRKQHAGSIATCSSTYRTRMPNNAHYVHSLCSSQPPGHFWCSRPWDAALRWQALPEPYQVHESWIHGLVLTDTMDSAGCHALLRLLADEHWHCMPWLTHMFKGNDHMVAVFLLLVLLLPVVE